MDVTPIIAISLVTLVGLLLLAKGLLRLFARPLSASITSTAGLTLTALGILGIGSAINIASYTQLTAERPLATLAFHQSGPQRFTATLTLLEPTEHPANSSQAPRQFLLQGDEWRLEGKLIKWHGYGQLLGLDTLFKFDRISGRYLDTDQERSAVRTLYELSAQPGLDLWSQARKIPFVALFMDARYGTGTYLPMYDQAEYVISVSATGLVARPTTDAAQDAVNRWF